MTNDVVAILAWLGTAFFLRDPPTGVRDDPVLFGAEAGPGGIRGGISQGNYRSRLETGIGLDPAAGNDPTTYRSDGRRGRKWPGVSAIEGGSL